MISTAGRLRLPFNTLAREIIFIGMPVVVFIILLGIVVHGAPTSLDLTVARHLQAFAWGSFGFVPQLSSDLGGGLYGFYLVPVAVSAILAITRQWRLLALVVAVFILHFMLISPKLFIEAYRPSPAFGVEGAGGQSSFPSGHVQWAVSFYGLFAYLAWQRVERISSRIGIAGMYAGVVLLTMLARIDLGRHWPLDTVAGVLAGIVAIRLVIMIHHLTRKAPVSSDLKDYVDPGQRLPQVTG